MADRFFIAPYDRDSGLRSNFKPWLIPDQAFAKLNNAYVWRGRIRKRFGSRWVTNTQTGTRLRVAVPSTYTALPGGVAVGITDGSGDATGTVPGIVFEAGQRFIIGAAEYLVVTEGGIAEPMSASIPTTTTTYDTSNGAYVFVGAPANQQIYFYNGSMAITNGSGNVTGQVPGGVFAIGQMFSIGTQLFTVVELGNPGTLLISGTATLAEFDTTTGIVTITGAAPNTQLYFYPSLPVMGLLTMDSISTVSEPTIAFDTRFAYNYIGDGWERLSNESDINASEWTGDNSQFFYGVTWVGDNGSDKVFFVTNFNETEPNFMRYLDGNSWHNYRPQLSANPPSATDTYLFSAKIILIFHNHVIALNTWEGTLDMAGVIATNTNYQNRVLWSAANESPTNNNPTAWRQDIPGKGSGLDAATTESIIGAEFVQDRLMVYFERSTWELVYTGNAVQPFTWQQIDTELGAESTFSIIPLDKAAIGVATTGIHACNGISVQRIDQLVPELIDDIANDHAGAARVYGIRDYKAEMIYWAYPDTTSSTDRPFPNKTLLYNYVNNTWATNDDSITCFGYFQQKTGVLWDSTTVTWNDAVSWNTSGNNNLSRVIMAGNQEGFTYITSQDLTYNAPSLQITDILVIGDTIALNVIDNCVKENTYILIQNITGSGTMTSLNGQIFQVLSANIDSIGISATGITGTYTGGGTITLISNIEITTKEYSFYLQQGRNSFVNKVDFMVKRTDMGQIGVQFRTSTNTVNLTAGAESTGALVGTGVLVTTPYALYPYEKTSERLVHPVCTSVSGEFVQLTLTFTTNQLMSLPIMQSDFQLHSMLWYAQSTSRLQ